MDQQKLMHITSITRKISQVMMEGDCSLYMDHAYSSYFVPFAAVSAALSTTAAVNQRSLMILMCRVGV